MRPTTLCLALLLALLALHMPARAQEAQPEKPAPAPDVPQPGKLVPTAAERYADLDKRTLVRGMVHYTEETLAALQKAGIEADSALWWGKRISFYRELAKQPGFGAFINYTADAELPAAECGDEFLLLTAPGGAIAKAKADELAQARGLKLLDYAESKAAEGLRTIDPGFTAEAVREFWVKGRKVEWALVQPRKSVVTVNGVDKSTWDTWTGTYEAECSEVKDDVYTINRSYDLNLKTRNGSRGSGGMGRSSTNTMAQMLLISAPLISQFVNMTWLECYSTRQETTLEIGGKEYKCVHYTTRKRFTDGTGQNYVYSEFLYCPELPGVPLKVVHTEVEGEVERDGEIERSATRTSTQVFSSTTVE